MQVHFKHFHDRDTPIVQSAGIAKCAHVMLKCEYLNDILEDLENHLIQIHKIDLFNNLLNLKIIPESWDF